MLLLANLAKSLDLTQRNTSRDLDDIFPLEIPIPTTSWPPDRGLQDEPSSGKSCVDRSDLVNQRINNPTS